MSEKTADPLQPSRVGPYQIEDQLGVGGMGAVYRARDERLKRPVAIKRLLPEVDDPLLRERFRREAQAAASLNHSSIVHIYDIVEAESGDWIVMELVEGRRLDQLLRRGPLELNHALRVAREVARGLAEAHAKGIIHRDLKAENVMITRGGHAKILDFGLAKFDQEIGDPDLSTHGSVLGTARVMSPEQAMGIGVDLRSDLFSFGTLLYEAVTGRSPFKAAAVVETLRRVCTHRQTPAHAVRPEVPTELSKLIDRLLEKDPEARPRNAREVIAALLRIAEAHAPESMDDTQSGASIGLLSDSDPGDSGSRDSGSRDGGSRDRGSRDRGPGDDEADVSDPARNLHDSTTAPHRPLASRSSPIPAPDVDSERPLSSQDGEISPTLLAPTRAIPRPFGGIEGARAQSPTPEPAKRTASPAWQLEPTVPHFTRTRKVGERRQVTVVCCDLLGERADSSYGLLEPETLYEVMPTFRRLATESVRRFDGCLGQILGHRLWAFFGYPRAHGDDAERAVRAALDLVDRCRSAGFPQEDSSAVSCRLAVRVGIHTGQAVVTPGERSEGDIALGPTFELAEAIRELAEPHGVAVTGETHRLISPAFVTEVLERAGSKAAGEPRTAHRIVAPRDARSRLEGSASLLPLVGRERELTNLVELWNRVRRGTGQVVILSGEAGSGKTRLVQALKERLRADDPPWWIAVGSAFTRSSPLHPIVELLRSLLEAVPGDSLRRSPPTPQEALLERLEVMLEAHRFSLPELVPLFASLLRLPLAGRYEALRATSARQRARTLEALNALLLEKAEQEPSVMVVEDLQWVDPSTLELLDLLLDQVPAAPLLLILTHRPDFDLPWSGRDDVLELRPEPLEPHAARQLVQHVVGTYPLPGPIRDQIVARADGVPLFLEEMTRSVLETDLSSLAKDNFSVTPSSQVAIPTTLRDSLTARLDLLTTAKGLVQRAAVIGREFSYDVLLAVSGLAEEALEEELDRVVRSGLVHAAPTVSPARRYLFKNVLIQEIAYGSLLKRERQEIHLEVARAFEKIEGESAAPEILARHYTRGRLPEKAAACWLAAGQAALARSANVEAVEHLRKGLSMLGAFAPGEGRNSMELALECSLLPALIAIQGYTAPEVRQVMDRAYELCGLSGDTPQLFWAIRALWAHQLLRGDTARARKLALRLLRHAAAGPGPIGEEVHARYAFGITLYYRGEYEGAREHLERGLGLDDSGLGFFSPYGSGPDAGLASKSALGLTLWHLGCPDRALEECRKALAEARQLDHPYSLAYALQAEAWVHLYRGDYESLLLRSQELVAHCREQNLWLAAVGRFLVQCARTALRLREPELARDEGAGLIEGLERGLDGVTSIGVGLALLAGLCHVADFCLRLGSREVCRGLLERASELLHEGAGRHWAPELDRIRGRLALTEGEAGPAAGQRKAEGLFESALAGARAQGDRSLALRAATDLAGLRRDQKRFEEARDLVERALDDLEDGYETLDGKAGRALLETLVASSS